MKWRRRIAPTLDIQVAFLSILSASLLIHDNRPAGLTFLGIGVLAFIIGTRRSDFSQLVDLFALKPSRWSWLAVGTIYGLALAVMLRLSAGMTPLPQNLSTFLPLACLIGATEELVFRGYFMGRLQQQTGAIAAIFLSSTAHALYKGALFINESQVSLLLLVGLTFLVGITLALLRLKSASLWPCIAFHMVFDAIVYGNQATPWWVW